MWTRGMQGPWDTERYSELDLCLVFRRWANSIKNVESDSLTNVNTDHLALNVTISQKLNALFEAEHGKELRGAKSESEQQTIEYNEVINEIIRKGRSEDRGKTNTQATKSKEEGLPPRTGKDSRMQNNSIGTGLREGSQKTNQTTQEKSKEDKD